LQNKDFNKYAEDMLGVRVSVNECPRCRKDIKHVDVHWYGGEENQMLCVHTQCGAVFKFYPETEVYQFIGAPYNGDGTFT